jgi:hypothetical protein
MSIRLSKYVMIFSIAVYTAALVLATGTATAQVLFSEDFEDTMLAENSQVNANVTIENGIAKFNDPAETRATFTVVRDFTDPVMTFSFDVVEPVVEAPPRMEMLFRAGIGTAHNTLQSGDQIVEAIMYRTAADPTRGAYMNNGDETIFLVANNKATDLTFTSPIDDVTQVTLPGFNYIPYVRDNTTGMFGEVKGISAFAAAHQPVFGTFNRFGIGSSTTGDVGTFAIDNVLVVSGVSFEQNVGPTCILGDADCNNIVDMADFEPIRANFRNQVTSRAQGDLVRDGVVNFSDFQEWKAAFLAAGGSLEGVDLGFTANVPEPSTAAMLILVPALATACRSRGRRANGGSRGATHAA